jgi:hypothetical protein
MRRDLMIFSIMIGVWDSTAARAETIDLVCSQIPVPGMNVQLDRSYVRIDTSAGTAVMWQGRETPDKFVPDPAVVTKRQVTWTDKRNAQELSLTLDRRTGKLEGMTDAGSPGVDGSPGIVRWDCLRKAN